MAAFALEADRQVFALARSLESGGFRPGPYRLIFISDPKRRVVAAAPVRDRVVHHAIHLLTAKRFERSFIDHSYACLPGKGSHRAILRFLEAVRHYRYVLQLDVRRYFYCIDHVVLTRLLFRHLPEPKMQELIARIIASGAYLYRRGDVVRWLEWNGPGRVGAGLPIGNLTSQFWGNVYLNELDHLICRTFRVPWYQRYMDDFTLASNDARQLVEVRERIREWLAQARRLELKAPDAKPQRTNGRLHYLGYEVTRGGLRLGPKARGRMPERLCAAADNPKRLAAAINSYAAAWKFGQ